MNYGGIGMVVGHELTHAFDNNGRKFDSNGRLNDWWSNHTAEEFKKKSECFVKQYEKFFLKGPDGSSMNVNGKLTLGEVKSSKFLLFTNIKAYKFYFH